MTYDVRSTWAQLEELILDPVVDFVEHVAYKMPRETDWNSSLKGSWYLSPKRHVVEFILFNTFFFLSSRFFVRRMLAPGSPQERSLRVFTAPVEASLAERVMLLLTAASLAITVVHKYIRNSMLFLLQPCHISATVLILILSLPKSGKVPHVAFNVYLHTMWGTVMALAFPDLRDYDMFFEVENFWLEHWMLLIVPVYLIYSRSVDLWKPSLTVALVSYFLKCLYHSLVLSVFALLSGCNLNYLLSPPPMFVLHMVGAWYRPFMYFTSLVLTVVTRFLVVEAAVRILPRKKQSKPLKKS